MAKRSLNDTAFGVHGVNPSLAVREDSSNSQPSQTAGKIILKR